MQTNAPDAFGSREVPPTDPLISCVIDGRYRVTQRLGAGGMGVVYAAHHQITGREVAIKVLHPSPHHSEESLARFAREARTAAATGHPNIVEVLDAGALPDGTPFLVMERLHGEALGHLLWREQRLTPARVQDVVIQAAWALSALHARGVIHRDVKTDNLFVEHDGRVKLLDFGLAVFTDGHRQGRVTQDGVFNGTPQYMPPEVFDGAGPTVAWDVYALATVAFELLTGTVPFHDVNAIVMLCAKRETVAPRLSDRVDGRFPAALERVIRRGLERDPARRHASPIDFAEDFARAVGATSGRTEITSGRSRPVGTGTEPVTATNSMRDAAPLSGWAALQVPWRQVLRVPLILAACCAVLLATWITATRSAESSAAAPLTASEVLTADVTEPREPPPAPPIELVVAPEARAEANDANEIGAVERAVVAPSRRRRSSPPVTTVVFGARTASDEATAIVEAARWVSMRWDDVAHAGERSAPGPSNERP